MKCPFCSHEDLKVTDSRNAIDANAIRRRRECLKCNRRFTTFEMVELAGQSPKARCEEGQEGRLAYPEGSGRFVKMPLQPEQVRALAARMTQDLMQMQIKEVFTKEISDILWKYLNSDEAFK